MAREQDTRQLRLPNECLIFVKVCLFCKTPVKKCDVRPDGRFYCAWCQTDHSMRWTVDVPLGGE